MIKSIQNIYSIDLLRQQALLKQSACHSWISLRINATKKYHFKINLENKAFVCSALLLNPRWRSWEEDERKGNDLVTSKKGIPNPGNTAGRLPKGPHLERISFSTLRNPESEATGLNSFPRKYCRGLNNKMTHWKEDRATSRAIDEERHV